MKDTCIAVCCAFYCTCLVLSFYCTCVVLSLTNVCEMPTLWEGITSMGASIASVNRQIVFKQHLETCSSQFFFISNTHLWLSLRKMFCVLLLSKFIFETKFELHSYWLLRKPPILELRFHLFVWQCSLYSGLFLAPTEKEYFLGEVFMESKMILGVRIRDIEARTSFPKYDENCAWKKKDAVVGWHKVAVGDWSYWSASPTMNCGGAAGQQGRALQWTAPGRPTPQIVGQRYHNEQTPIMSNSGNHLYFCTFHSMSFFNFGSDIINNCTFAYKWIWTNTLFEMYYKFAKISGILFYKITLKLYDVLMIYLLQIHLSVGQSLTELATSPAPRLTDIPMTRAAIYIFIYTVHSMYHLQYRHTHNDAFCV